MKGRSWILSAAFGLGLVAAFVGERLVGAGTGRTVLTTVGVALVLGAFSARLVRMVRAEGDRRRAEGALLGLLGVGLGALALYFVQSDLWATVAGAALDRSSPKLAGSLAALWPAFLSLSVLPTLLVEMAYAGMVRAPQVELGRIRDALLSGVGLTSAIVFAFTAYYVASERDVKWDFSWFRTAAPGEATRNLVRSLDEPVEVSVFFPPANDVREQVIEYLDDLASESPNLKLSAYDEALNPKRARELGVTGNGTVVVSRGSRKELLGLGLELERARGQLRGLDREFQKRLLQVAKQKRTVYFTVGHGERAADKTATTDHRWTVRVLREGLGTQNFDVKNLGVAEGLATAVPKDAAAVIIAGPTEPFLPEELTALESYLEEGGRVLLALDAEVGQDFSSLLGRYGVRFTPTILANDQLYLPRARQLSDRMNIATAAYSSHPAVTSLGRLGQRAPLLLVGSGFIEAVEDRPATVRVDVTVHSHPTTFADTNGNFELDAPEEKRGAFGLAAAVSRTFPERKDTEARLLVLADSDVLGDPVMENAGNVYLARDGLKWLVGDDAIAGETNSEEDVRIQHTRKQDVAWFYSTVFLAPLLVLGVGFVATRRKARSRS